MKAASTQYLIRPLTLGIAATLLGACASTPKSLPSVEEARAAVQQVESAPGAGEYAADEVQAAHEALRHTDELVAKRKPRTEIDHQAYIAKRHAQIAMQQLTTAQAKQVVKEGESERERAVLEARAREAAALAARNAQDAQRSAQQVGVANEQIAALQQQLKDLNAKQTERGMVLTLGDVLFDTGKATLKPGAQSTLERLAAFLNQSSDSSVIIEGHTDSMGSDDYNMELSQRRAEAVKAALVQRNIDPQRVVAVGKGEAAPVAGNESASGRQQNRRVELVIQNAQNRANENGRTASGAG